MAILGNKDTKVIVQGITGGQGTFHTRLMIEYGTNVVGGVVPGKGGQWFDKNVPIFDTVAAAVEATGATASMVIVPAPFAPDGIVEAVDAGIDLIICLTEHIPVADMMKATAHVKANGARLIGPNCPGFLVPGQMKIGIIPTMIAQPGNVGVVSKSGTLTYEVGFALMNKGMGQSTIVGIGGDSVIGTSFVDILEMFENDPETEKVYLVDWGSAVMAQLDVHGHTTANNIMDLMSSDLQNSNARLGDVYFIGHEQISGEMSSPRFDEQGLAATLYALASGQSCRYGTGVITPSSLGLPKLLAQILSAMLSKDRNTRNQAGDYFFKHLDLLKNTVMADPPLVIDVKALVPVWCKPYQQDIDTVVYGSRKSFLRESAAREKLDDIDDVQLEKYYKNFLMGMGDTEKAKVIELSQALLARQAQKDDESILPKVGLEDVPADIHVVEGTTTSLGNIPLSHFAQGTNGLVYQQIIIDLPALNDELIELLPYYTSALTELGVGNDDYLATQHKQASICGSISAFTTMRSDVNSEQQVKSYLVLSSKALARNQQHQAQLMKDTLQHVRFDELPRLRELIGQQRARREQSVTNNGHSLAMVAASSGMSPYAKLSHNLTGLAGIQAVKTLDTALQDEQQLKIFGEKLKTLHNKIRNAHKQLLVVAEADHLPNCIESLNALWQNDTNDQQAMLTLPAIRDIKKQLWVANTQVNFCAKASLRVYISQRGFANSGLYALNSPV